MRRPAAKGKADKNQAEIVKALKACGVPVMNLSASGDGVPDLAAYHLTKGIPVFLEVKTEKGRLTKAQKALHPCWQVVTVRTVDEAFQAVGLKGTR